jgi:hypothetical protein
MIIVLPFFTMLSKQILRWRMKFQDDHKFKANLYMSVHVQEKYDRNLLLSTYW